jgi:hypothetical protein
MRRVLPLLATAALLTGCGGEDEPGVASVVPADAAAFAELPLRDGDNESPLLAAAGDPATILRSLDSTVDYERDVEPWLGERVAAFAAEGRVGLVLEADDGEAAERFARRRRGAVVEGHVVLGAPETLAAARRAAEGDSLADSDPYEALDERAGDREGLALVAPSVLRGLTRSHVSAVIRAGGRSAIVADVEGLDRGKGRAPALGAIPSRAVLAFASPDVGRDVEAAIGESELLEGLRERFGVNLRATLKAVGAGRLWIGDGRHAGFDAVPKDTELLLRQARALHRRERRRGKRLEAYLPKASGQDDPFVQLFVAARGRDPAYSVEVEDELLDVDIGPEEDERLLRDTPLYRDATRVLGGEPTALLDVDRMPENGDLERVRFVAARDTGGGKQRVVVALRP